MNLLGLGSKTFTAVKYLPTLRSIMPCRATGGGHKRHTGATQEAHRGHKSHTGAAQEAQEPHRGGAQEPHRSHTGATGATG